MLNATVFYPIQGGRLESLEQSGMVSARLLATPDRGGRDSRTGLSYKIRSRFPFSMP